MLSYFCFQEIDLTTGTLATIQHGSRKLLGKANPIHAIQVQNGLVYSASSPLDGAAVKVSFFRKTNRNNFLASPSPLHLHIIGSTKLRNEVLTHTLD